MAPTHPSIEDTIKHSLRVYNLLRVLADKLVSRGADHDFSKTVEPEVSIFDEFSPKLAASTYGSDEYKGFLAAMKPALEHHYFVNAHHPEHHPNGINDMTLIDLLEMICDWIAASERHKTGDAMKSIEINAKRFSIGDQLKAVLQNTVRQIKENEQLQGFPGSHEVRDR